MATILIIDDDAAIRAYARSLFESLGHSVIEAATGIEGERAFHSVLPDVMFTDIFMPNQDGLQTIKNIRKTNKSTPIIAISSGGPERTDDYLRYAEILGATHIVSKSATTVELLKVLSLATLGAFPMASFPLMNDTTITIRAAAIVT